MAEVNLELMYELYQKVNNKQANEIQQDEFMNLLYLNKNLPKEMYARYLSGTDRQSLINFGLVLGSFTLFSTLITKWLDQLND